MSLLLEALKKAEKAKEEAQRRAKGGDAGAHGDAQEKPSAFDPETTVVDDGRHVTRRNELPDISAPLEILSDDLRPAGAPKAAAPLELRLADEPPPPREPAPAPRREPTGTAEARNAATNTERATAQRVFEAKFREPNPRLPFFIVMGVLGAFAIGTAVYFWIQLRPAPSLVNTNPQRPSDERPVDAAALKPPAAVATTQAGPAAGAIPGLPGGTSIPAPAPPAPAAAASPAPAPSASPTAAPTASPAPAAAPSPAKPASARNRPAAKSAGGGERSLSVNRAGPQIHPQVAIGYAAYQAGDQSKARDAYQQALQDEPANRDALLGLAAVEMRARRYDLADAYFQRVLQANPRDAHAQAGVVALRAQQLDPVQVESRVKSLIAVDRDANVLHFTLGNQYALQGRWAEAQQAYFKAYTADPANPDFAFNLAVSLDQLRQPKLALEYYQRALALSEKRVAAFAPDVARTRVQQLSR